MEELQKLFNVLKREGYYTKSFDDFQSQYQDEAYRDKVFNVVSRDGFYTKSKEEFLSKFSLGDVKKKDSIPLEERVDVTESVTEEVPVEDTLSALQSPEQFQFGEQVEETPIPLRPEDVAPEEAPIQPTEFDPEKFVAPEEPLTPGEFRKNQADVIFDRLNRQKSIRDELIKQKVEKGEIDESDIDLESVVQEKFPELKDQVKRELSAQDDWINKFGTLEGYETEEDFFEGAFGSALKTFDDVTYIGLGEFVDDLGRAVMSGRAQGNVAEATSDLLLKGSMASNEQIDKFIEAQKQAGEYQMSAEMKQYLKTSEEEGGFLGMVLGLAENPTVLLEVAATSFASMAANKESLDAAANVLEAGMAYGAGAGTTAGAALGGIGALPGAAVGTVTGFASAIPFAFGAASTVLEAGSKFSELLMEEVGDKPLNRENIRNMLNDKEAYKKIRNKAITRGLTVGIIDTAFGLIGGSVGAKMLSKGAGKGKVLAVTTGFEGTGGATGEALGTVAIGETPTWSDVGLEFFAETPGSAKTFIQSQIKATDPATYKINGNTVNESVIKDVVESMTPEELAESDITIENDKDLSDKMQNKIVKGAVKEQISQAKPELNDATVDKIADLQMEADKLKDNKTQAGKRKVAELNEQMKELEDNPIEAAPEEETAPTMENVITEEVEANPIKNKAPVYKKGGKKLLFTGSPRKFTKFDKSKIGSNADGGSPRGIFFSNDPEVAGFYANEVNGDGMGQLLNMVGLGKFKGIEPTIYSAVLNTENVKEVEFGGQTSSTTMDKNAIIKKAFEEGFDAVVLKNIKDGPSVPQDVTVVKDIKFVSQFEATQDGRGRKIRRSLRNAVETAPEVKVEEEVTEDVAPEEEIELFHATSEDFTDFKVMGMAGGTTESPRMELGIHLGTKQQSGNRAKTKNIPQDKQRLIKVKINPKNVVRVNDVGRWTLSKYRNILQDLGLISKERGIAKKEIKTFDDVLNVLNENNIDAFVYDNKFEGEGDSYIVFDNQSLTKVTEEVAPEPKQVRYEMNKTDKKIWRKDFEIIDNRDGKELGPPKENGKWVVVNKVTGQVVIATSKRDAQSIIDNAPAEPELFGEGQIVDADQIITPETGIEITDEVVPEVTEEESSLLSEMEDIDGQIESKQEEISIEQDDEKQEIARIDAEIKEVRASKMDRESKAERIDELKAEKSDYKDSQKSIIQDFKDDIKELKKEKRKAERKLKKISEKKPAVKVKPKENKPKVVRKPKKEKAKILEGLEDVKNITDEDKLNIADRIIKLAKDGIKQISTEVKNLNQEGNITTKQMNSILSRLSRVNPLSETSISKFVDYMANVIKDANYSSKMSSLNSKRKIAKNTANKKAGILSNSINNLRKIFNTDASIIPESVLSDYESLVEMFGKKDAVVSLDKRAKVEEMASNIVKGLNEQYSTVPSLIEKYSKSEKGSTYTQTINSMRDEGVINQDEYDLMVKYKTEILSQTKKVEEKTEEQKQEERKKLIKEIGQIKANQDSINSLDTRLERDDANNFFKLLKTKGLENLSTYDLKNISKIADNINNGYFTSYAKKISTNISSNNKALNLADNSIKKAKPLPISKFIGNVKSLLTNRKSTDEMIRRNPLKYIDNLFGDFKTTTMFDTVFKPIAEAYSRYKNQTDVTNIRIQNAQDKVFKSLGYDPNKFTLSSFKQMAYMIQREFLSNPDSKQVNTATDILNATIKKSKELKGFYDERDIQAFESILKDYTVDDVFDNEKLYDSFNKAEKESIDTLTDINQSMTPMAEYVSNIIYGEPIETLDNYISLNVLPEVKDAKKRGILESEAYKESLKPNTKSKLLIKRTGKPSAINMDVYSSVSNSSKKLLMDYHLSDTIRGTYKTLEDARKLIDSDSKKQLNTLNAIENAFDEALSNVLDTTFIETSFADDVLNYMTKTGYRTMLASAPRFVAELGSNLAFAAINSPTEFARGMKLAEFTSADNGSIIMDNVGSVNTSRIFGFDELSGKLVDSSLINKTQGREAGKMKGTVVNTLTKLVNKSAPIGKYDASLKSSYKAIEGVADKLISTPDKIVMQRLWMGTFDVEFKKITGKSPDFQKILKNDEAYMNENAKALEAAKKKSDNKTTQTGATDNPFMGILKGTVKPNQSTLLKGYNVFNKFMTKFLHFEYAAARTGVYAMVGRGEMSRKQGAALLAAVTVRMTLYTVGMNLMTEIMLKISNEIFGDEIEDEELLYADEKSFYQELGQALASTFTQLTFGRDFGNAFKSIINAGVEWFNEEQLQFLRNGDYDPYKDAIQFNLFQKTGGEGQSDLGDIIMKIGGPLTPFMKSIDFMIKQATAPEKTKADAIVRQNRERTDRLLLEIFGNLNMIPFYRDVKKMVYQDIYKDLTVAKKKAKIEKQAMEEKLMGYEDEKEMKTNDYSLWEVQFGSKSEDYDKKLAEKRLENLQRRLNKIIKEGGDINYAPAFRGGKERPRRQKRSSRKRR